MPAQPEPSGAAQPPDTERINGLDSIRGLCAIWVAFSHLGFFPELAQAFDKSSPVGLIARGVLGNLFSGQPAVIVFFIISGFCIHYPHAHRPAMPGAAFLARRLVRIGVPFAGAWLLLRALAPASQGLALVQWSLIAEVIYYLLYPLLFRLRRLADWRVWIGVTGLAAIGIAATQPEARYFWIFGPELTWAIGLPHWLVGCWLAECVRGRTLPAVSPARIWTLRLLVWFGASAASVVQFRLGIGYPWTMLVFTPLAAAWVHAEICWHATHAPVRLLEWFGAWSYSLYLLHLAGPDLLQRWGLAHGVADGTVWWLVNLSGALTICFTFHLLVEKPSHRLARWVGRRLARRPLPVVVGTPAS